MKSARLALVAVTVVLLGIAGCASQTSPTTSKPEFQVIVANWLLCPQSTTDLKACCPQPADPRRCVMPSGTAPTELVAYARFRNVGAAGGGMATLGIDEDAESRCPAPVPFTETGATTIAWCSLGAKPEPLAPPAIISVVASPR